MNYDLLHQFHAASGNDEDNKHLWVKGASLFIGQMNQLVNKLNPEFVCEWIDINMFANEYTNELGELFKKNGSDKGGPIHNYHVLYSYILKGFKDRTSNILEIGLGTNNPELVSTMGVNGRPGASLFTFRDYMPLANVYGADIDKDILFKDDRIDTCHVDQLEITTFDNIKETFGDIEYDLIIDDGLHSIGANFNTLLFAMDNIKSGGWIVIEDVSVFTKDNWNTICYLLKKSNKFKPIAIHARNSCIFCVNRIS